MEALDLIRVKLPEGVSDSDIDISSTDQIFLTVKGSLK